MRVTIQVLGELRIQAGGFVVDRLPTQRVCALLGYLACHPGWLERERLSEAIWPNLAEGKASASLRNALSSLRRVLEPQQIGEGSILETNRTQVRLVRPNCDCDLWEFERAASTNRCIEAADLYSGDLLPSLADEWLGPIRDRLQWTFLEMLSTGANQALESGDEESACRLAARWRDSDPYDAEAIRVYSVAKARLGRVNEAMAALNEFLEVYRREFDQDPDLDIQSLRQHLASTRSRASAATSSKSSTQPVRRPKLPQYLTRYFGRENEKEDVIAWAEGPDRLLTVIGTGGLGKTRLVVESARDLNSKGFHLIYVPLAAADTLSSIEDGLMSACELRDQVDVPKFHLIASALSEAGPQTILILDNLEHILDLSAKVVLELLERAPDLKCLTTSRAVLNLEGERVLKLRALSSRFDPEAPDSLQPAVQMFVDRARCVRPDFSLTPRNRFEITQLCDSLEGLPLAIEIMAAWSGTWTLADMQSRVDDNLIVARRRGHDPRHQSLEACIEWSYGLLDPELQEFLTRLSIFRGGWTLEAAQAIHGGAGTQDLLATLVDRSLVASEESETGLRFSMLEAVRTYARRHLPEATLSEIAPRFLQHFSTIATRLNNQQAGAQEHLNHLMLDAERDNVEVAVSLVEAGHAPAEDAMFLLGKFFMHWTYRGQSRLGISLIDRLLEAESQTSPASARAKLAVFNGLSVLTQEIGDRDRAEQALLGLNAVAKEVGDMHARFGAVTQLGNFMTRWGNFEATIKAQTEALEIANLLDDPILKAAAHCNLADGYFGLDRFEEARMHWQIAADIDQRIGNPAGEALLSLGLMNVFFGEFEAAHESLAAYLKASHRIGFLRGSAKAIEYVAYLAARLGLGPEACKLLATAEEIRNSQSISSDVFEIKAGAIVFQYLRNEPCFGARRPMALEEVVEFVGSMMRQTGAPVDNGVDKRADQEVASTHLA